MRIRKAAALLLAVLLCGVQVFAHDVPDASKTGSISITMRCAGSAVAGGTLTLYQVGQVAEEDGNYGFDLTDEFADSGADLSDISSANLAETLAAYAESQEGTTAEIGTDGTVAFSDLELGLYLLVQYEAAPGYDAVASFLVSVPMYLDGTYVYDVDASPKVEVDLSPSPEPSPEPSASPEPSEEPSPSPSASAEPSPSASSSPSASPSPSATLPYTGQLNWPVPVLVVAGLLLLSVGFVLCGKRDGREE